MHLSKYGEADPGPMKKDSGRSLDLPSQEAEAVQAKGQAELGLLPEPLRQWAQQAMLLAREVSAFRSPGDR